MCLLKILKPVLIFSGLAASKLKIMRSLLSSLKPKTKDEFVPLLEKDLKILQDMEQTDSVKQQIAFIEKTLSETKNPVFIKVPDQQMLDVAQGIVSQYLRNNNYPVRFTRENVIYTSGIIAVY